MKTKIFFTIFLLISLLGLNQVKADTIYYQLPQPTQHLCVDVNDLPTFVIYKPNGFGGTMWNISGQYYGTGDSIVYTPTSTGSYGFGATWDSNPEGMVIYLYSQPPAHVQFQVLGGGGIVNSTNDTVWMCGNSVTIGSESISGSNVISLQWTGPGSFFSNYVHIVVSLPGTYIFEQVNSCGITRDTIEVVQLPTQLPTIPNILRCNQPLAETLDAGPGWFTYLWNTGATSQSIQVTQPGTFTVQLNNACASGQVSITAEQQTYPIPDLNQYSTNINIDLCHGEVANLIPHPTYVYDTYQWRKGFVNPAVISTASTLNVDYQMGMAQYYLTVTQGSCMETDMAIVIFYQTPFPTEMCVATFDPTLGINKVVFQHDGQRAEDFVLCYKQGQNWVIIDSVLAIQDPTIVYNLLDNVNDPNQQSRTYTVFARHSCGHMSPLGDWHKTIMVGIFQDVMSGNYVLQVMDGYQTFSGYQPSSYTIWVDSLNNGNLTEVGVLNGGNSFVIQNPISGGAYYASVDLPWNCDGTKTIGVSSFSNKRTFSTVGIQQINTQNKIKIFPNPSSGIFHIDGDYNSVEVFNAIGQSILLTEKTKSIDLSNFEKGIYFVKIKTIYGPSIQKIVIQ